MSIDLVLLNRQGGELSVAERNVLESAVAATKTFKAGEILVRENVTLESSTLLLEGLVTRHVDDREGRRHLVALHIPGDFVDLHGYALKHLDHDVGALTDVVVATVPHDALRQIQEDLPHLTHRLWFLTTLDAAIHRQWVFRQTSLSAIARIAHFICEMNARFLAIGMSSGRSFSLQMTQGDIGEVCGLTNVHVNRVIRELRELNLCTIRGSAVDIHDLAALAKVGEFKPDYLYLNPATAQRASGLHKE